MGTTSNDEEPEYFNPVEWVNEKAVKYYLTIEDIENIPTNSTINIFLMTKNIYNLSYKRENQNKIMDPLAFFKNCHFILYTKLGDGIKGKWKFNAMLDI